MVKNYDLFGSFLLRYLILVIAALPNLWIFYFILTPLTLYPVYALLSLFFSASLMGSTIMVNSLSIELIDACIAGSAYYLLLIFNLSVPNIKLSERVKMLLFAFGTLLIINILRIFLLSLLAISGSSLFDITHKIFWYLISIAIVVGIWFIEVKIFKIKGIPLYTDLKFLYKKSLNEK